MDQPLISVIIPSYNCEDFIIASINSIINQSYQQLEILVADDYSKDNTRKTIDSLADPRIKRFHNDKNLGYLKTCNKLFKEAKGDYLAFQDADDISEHNRFELQIDEFLRDPELGVVGTNMVVISNTGEVMKKTSWDSDINKSIEKSKFDFIPNSFLFKREVYEKVGGYNEYFDRIGFEDFYWSVLMSEHFKMRNLSETLYHYRTNPDSVTLTFSNSIKLFSYNSLLFLKNQRKISRTDWLQEGRVNLLKSKIYIKLFSIYFDKKEYTNAFYNNLKAIKFNPFSLYNIRTLFYLLKAVVKNSIGFEKSKIN
jgi:glycosyltransferase involved in cell wall biosynthesis